MKGLLEECERVSVAQVPPETLWALQDDLRAPLLPHQREAVDFLAGLYPAGAIVADEMGLGKTFEALAFLAWLFRARRGARFLVVCPLSVASNWVAESERFTRFRPLLLAGTQVEREQCMHEFAATEAELLVTTFEHAVKEEGFLRSVQWDALVVDEAHRLKNCESVLYKTLASAVACPRVLLTGTPVHNNLDELYSLLHFCAPKTFADAYRAAFSHARGEELQGVLRKFMLRRTKEDVKLGIPPKVELVLYCSLSLMQREYYKTMLAKDYQKMKQPASLSNVLMNLRKVCNHPYMFDGAEPTFDGEWKIGDHLIDNAGKMVVLDVLLQKLHREKRKVLLFSTMTRMLDILQDYVGWRGWNYQRLDGSVRAQERDFAVSEFQKADSDSFIFLLSTRAGGVGLNLTSATAVIFFDSDWNPQMDLQAQARCHRIGQTQEVLVVRLFCSNSVEDYIWKRSRSKALLAETVLAAAANDDGGDPLEKLSSKEVLKILHYGVADLDGAAEATRISEADIDAMLNDAREGPSAREGTLKKAKTIVRVRAKDEVVGVYQFEGEDFAAKRDERDREAFDAIVAKAEQDAKRLRSPKPPTDEPRPKKVSRSMSKEERWAKNGYVSRKLDEPEDEDENVAECELAFVNGNAAECVYGDATRPKIVVCVVDPSGQIGRGAFFGAIEEAHGQGVWKSYAAAKKNQDLHMGDAHLVPSSAHPGSFVVLCVAISQSDRTVQSNSLLTALQAVSHEAARIKASVHSPRLDADWYSCERLLRRCFATRGVPCYVYYFVRTVKLPDFLAGMDIFVVLSDDAQHKEYVRHAVAYGANVVDSAQQASICVTDDPSVLGHVHAMVVTPDWLRQCFRERVAVDCVPFLAGVPDEKTL